jgi:heptosyltransferase-2
VTGRDQRILIRAPNWLGDAVLALPAMAAIRRHFANAHLAVAAPSSVAALFREDTDVSPDAVIELPSALRAVAARLEGEGFDVGVLFPNSFRSAWQLWRAGVRERWGYARAGRSLLLTRRSLASRETAGPHQSDYYRALVRGLGVNCPADEPPRLAPRAPTVERARAILSQARVDPDRPVIGLAPGAAYGQAKQWHPDQMADAVRRVLAARPGTAIVFGASHDRDASRAIESWFRTHAPDLAGRLVNLTGRTSLGALVGLVSRLSVFISNDSGAMHVAAAVGCPVVAVFGPTDERATRPVGSHTVISAPVFCRPCMLRDCPIDHRCMKRVSSAAVGDAVIEALDRHRGAAR